MPETAELLARVPLIAVYALTAAAALALAARCGWLQPAGWPAQERVIPGGVSVAIVTALLMVLAGAATGVAGWRLPNTGALAAFLTNVGLLLGAASFFNRVGFDPESRRSVGISPTQPRRDVVVGLGGFLVGVALAKGCIALVLVATGQTLDTPPRPVLALPPAEVLLEVVSIVVTAPVLEELVYRGLLQTVLLQLLGRRRRVLVVLFSATVFALVHASGSPWEALPGLFVLGVVLGAIYERTGSLLPCIVAHALYNGLNLGISALG